MRCRAALAAPLLLTLLYGCGPDKKVGPHVLDRLPDPEVGRKENQLRLAARPEPVKPQPVRRVAPAPTPKPRAAPVEADSGWFPPGGFSTRWKYIVIHHSDADNSTPQGIIDWHVNHHHWDEMGYHFLIGNGIGYPDGKVYVGSRWPKQKHGAHARVKSTDDNRWNLHGIGICLIGNFEKSRPTERQLQSLSRLVAYLSQNCNISPGNIYTHGDVDPFTKCPGTHFSLGEVKRRVAAVRRPAMAARG